MLLLSGLTDHHRAESDEPPQLMLKSVLYLQYPRVMRSGNAVLCDFMPLVSIFWYRWFNARKSSKND
jgi:hypothetical protein